ncbi:MAG: ABATE domain-containing protein [Anaerolineae bacterium]|nr:ABATE domain-containing protein [Anaerolineae bacterium]
MMQRHKFQFIGEALAFDFVNTEIVVRRKPVDLLNTADDLLEWWNAALDHYDMRVPVPPGQDIRAAFMRAKTLRSALRRLFTAVVEKKPPLEADLEILNDVLSVGHSRLVVTPENRFGVDHVSEKNDAMLLTIVHSAAWLLTEC